MTDQQSTSPDTALNGLHRAVAWSLARSRRGYQTLDRRRPSLAVEISAESLRALGTTKSGPAGQQLGALVQAFAPAEVSSDPAERARFFGLQIRRMLAGRPQTNLICVLPPGAVRSTIVTLPPLEGADEVGALAVKLMKLITGQPSQWAVDVTPLEDADAEGSAQAMRRYLLSAVPRTQIEELVATAAESGFLPCAITNASVLFPRLERVRALEEPVGNDNEEDEESGASVVVQIRSSKTGIHIYRHGTLEYSREIEWGGNDVTNALTDVVATTDGFIELSFADAERLKQQVGIPPNEGEDPVADGVALNASQVRMMLQPKLSTFVFELRNSIRYYQQASGCRRLARLTLTGGGSRLPGLDDFLHQQLKLRPHRFGPDDTDDSCSNLSRAAQDDLFTLAPQLVAAVQGGAFSVDMVPPAVRTDRLLRRPFRVAMIVGTFAIATCLAMTQQLAGHLEEARALTHDADDAGEYVASQSALAATLAEVELELADLDRVVGFRVPVTEVLAELGRCTPPEAQLLRVTIEDQDRNSVIRVRGVIGTSAASTEQPSVALSRAFRESPYFAELEIEALQRQSESNRFEFTLALVPYCSARNERP